MFKSKISKSSFELFNKEQIQKAIEEYNLNPKVCTFCNKVIELKQNEQPSKVRSKKFCDQSCAAKMNNKLFPRNHGKIARFCQKCKKPLQTKRKYCTDCGNITLLRGLTPLVQQTKKKLFTSRKNWQSARSSIVYDAKKKFIKSGNSLRCSICGYSTHIEIAHKRPVSDFPDTATIGEINDLTNLIPLCRNHHWEQEKGLITLDSLGETENDWVI